MAFTLTDADLFNHLGTTAARATVDWLADGFQALFSRLSPADLHAAAERLERDPAGVDPLEVIRRVDRALPGPFAQRMTCALGLYRDISRRCLPPMIPLAHRMAQAELLLFVKLSKQGKPYRDHLAHMTSVAGFAHLVFSGWTNDRAARAIWPDALFPDRLINARWAQTPEYGHLHGWALRQGFTLPDPGTPAGKAAWLAIAKGAAVLAGLLHDLGYVHKSLPMVIDEVGATFEEGIWFEPVSGDHSKVRDAPICEMYRAVIDKTAHAQRYSDVAQYVIDHFKALHSGVGALWLATAEDRLAQTVGCLDQKPTVRGQKYLIALQLAAMLAFAHDLGIRDKPDRKEVLLRDSREHKGQDALNINEYPLCTLFTLVDVLQEQGRMVRLVDELNGRYPAVVFAAPVLGLRFRRRAEQRYPLGDADGQEKYKERDNGAGLLWKPGWALPRKRPGGDERLYLSYVTREPEQTPAGTVRLMPEWLAKVVHRTSEWQEHKVGQSVAEWLPRAGLDEHVALDGDAEALDKLWSWVKELDERQAAGMIGDKDQSIWQRLIAQAKRLLDARFPGWPGSIADLHKTLSDMRTNRPSDRLPRIAPVTWLIHAERLRRLRWLGF